VKAKHLPLIVTGVFAAGFLALTLSAVSRGVQTLSGAAEFLRNPFGLTGRTASGPVVLQEMQRLQRLETGRYTGQVVVEREKRGVLPTWVAGDRLLFVGQGEVTLGVDLARLHDGDIRTHGDAVEFRLPPVEVLHTRLDNDASRVYQRQAGFLTGPDAQLETEARREAEGKIRQAALESGALRSAGENARDVLRKQLGALGFRQIYFQ
jgi:hypothetical protein